MSESEIKDKTVRLKRRYQELTQLFKYLQKNMPKMDIVDGKAARHANIPKPPNKLVEQIKGKGLVKSATHWPGSMSKSAEAHIGEENTKYQKFLIILMQRNKRHCAQIVLKMQIKRGFEVNLL